MGKQVQTLQPPGVFDSQFGDLAAEAAKPDSLTVYAFAQAKILLSELSIKANDYCNALPDRGSINTCHNRRADIPISAACA